MEIHGINIPYLQNAIASGLDSVTKGIAQSTKVSGSGALEKALESFSAPNLGISGAADQWLAVSGVAEQHAADLSPAVSGVAEYPDPVTVLRSMSEVPVQSEAPVSARDLLQTLEDPGFRPEVTLSGGPLKDLRSVVEQQLRLLKEKAGLRSSAGSVNGLQSQDQMANFEIQPLQSEFSNASPTFRPGADASVLKPTVKDVASDGSLAGYGSAYSSAKELQPGVDNPNRLAAAAEAAAATTASSDADQRGIIIVGGKTEGTYFQTIDDTLSQLQTNAEPNGVQLLQQQVAALKDMASTVEQVVGLQQGISSTSYLMDAFPAPPSSPRVATTPASPRYTLKFALDSSKPPRPNDAWAEQDSNRSVRVTFDLPDSIGAADRDYHYVDAPDAGTDLSSFLQGQVKSRPPEGGDAVKLYRMEVGHEKEFKLIQELPLTKNLREHPSNPQFAFEDYTVETGKSYSYAVKIGPWSENPGPGGDSAPTFVVPQNLTIFKPDDWPPGGAHGR